MNNFYELCEYVKSNTVESIMMSAMIEFFGLTEIDKEKFSLSELKQKFDNENLRELSPKSEYFEDNIRDIKKNLSEYVWVYENLLSEQKSKDIFFNILKAKVLISVEFLDIAHSDNILHYFDKKIFSYGQNEVFVDCGGYTGDTALEFIKACPQYRNIYLYEAIPEIMNTCRDNLSYFIDEGSVFLRENAVYSCAEVMRFSTGNGVGDSKFDESGEIVVHSVSLDEDILETVTFIKMDIEGCEKQAIEGAKNHIINDNPKLAICIYHKVDDFWKIPKLIHGINPNYNYVIRHHQRYEFYDTVLYCIPKSGKVKSNIDSPFSSKIDGETFLRRYKALIDSIACYSDEVFEVSKQTAESKIWLIKQARRYKEEIAKQNDIIRELRNWAGQLEEEKKQLLLQLENYKEETMKQNGIIYELRDWTRQLEENKKQLLLQLEDYKEETSKQNDIIYELRDWIGQLEENKKQLLLQIETQEKELAKPWYKKFKGK